MSAKHIYSRLGLIGLSIWSLFSTIKGILEFLDTEEGDTALRDGLSQNSSSGDAWWWPPTY